MGRYDLGEQKKPVGLIIAVLIILVILALVAWLYLKGPKKSDEQVVQEISLPITIPEPPEAEDESIDSSTEIPLDIVEELAEPESTEEDQPLILPPLNESDDLFREEITSLSPNFSEMLTSQQLIQKYLVIINDFSQSQRPRKHMLFLRLKEPFHVERDEHGIFMSQRSYQRYDELAQGFAAIDDEAAIKAYQRLRPLMLQVYAGFAYPDEYQMEDIFQKAAAEIIAAPVIEGRIALVKPSVRYKFADKKLEALSSLHKQMLRMGPENTRIIQKKLRALIQRLVQINKE